LILLEKIGLKMNLKKELQILERFYNLSKIKLKKVNNKRKIYRIKILKETSLNKILLKVN